MKVSNIKMDIKSSWWILVSCVHFLASFFWSGLIFIDEDFGFDLIVMNDVVSKRMEHHIHVIVSKITAFLLILLIWKTIDLIVKKRIQVKEWVVFLLVFVFYSIIHAFYFPESFASFEYDNFMTYAYAIRNLPFYWHGALTSIYYSACLNVIPHPIIIQEFSIAFFSALVPFCLFRTKKTKLFVAILFLIPEAWSIITNPYRNNFYTILLLWTVLLVLYEKQQKRTLSIARAVVYVFLCSILAVWRTEGILFAIGLMVILLLVENRPTMKHMIGYIILFLAFSVLLNTPQKIGTDKYYGKDYVVLTSQGWLCTILSNPNANLSYEGAKEDLEAIQAIIPVDYLVRYSDEAFRVYNYEQGRSVTQSTADSDTQKEYMSATYRILFHNVSRFISNRLKIMLDSNDVGYQFPQYDYLGDEIVFPVTYTDEFSMLWQQGMEDLFGTYHLEDWRQNAFRINAYQQIRNVRNIWSDMFNVRYITFFGALLYVGYCILWLCIKPIRRKHNQVTWYLPFLVLIGIGEIALVTLGAPVGREAYYFPVYLFLLLVMSHIVEQIVSTEQMIPRKKERTNE